MAQSGHSYLFSGNAAFIEGIYESYLEDRNSVSHAWQVYFDQLAASDPKSPPDKRHDTIRKAFESRARAPRYASYPVTAQPQSGIDRDKQVAVLQLINSYRFLGHRQANLNPLDEDDRPEVDALDPEYHGLSAADMDLMFNTGSLHGPDHASLREILSILSTTYCGTIGSEFMHITDTDEKRWIQRRLELPQATPNFDSDKKRRILERLVAAQGLETYLHRKYVGQKRFSLEGGISLIPLLDELVGRSSQQGVKELILGMAHRGRLNVLVNTFGKSTARMFDEFEGKVSGESGSGDVKYHKGFSSDLVTEHGTLHAVLAFNPSHLEVIDPVVEGSVRARQQRRDDKQRNQVLPVLLHGDAAFAGQGVVMETLNLSETRGYATGGTLHVIINNQIGFTTSDPLDSRSTLYCTDVAKMVQAPIFHVNGDDPEAIVFIAQLALDYRMTFNKDVVVDMVCYRQHGHSEADEPSVTQPVMYQRITNKPPVNELYAQQLQDSQVIKPGEDKAMEQVYVERLEADLSVSGRPLAKDASKTYSVDYKPFMGTHWRTPADTAITRARISELTRKMTRIPSHFKLHMAVKKLLAARNKMGAGELGMDWGYAETLAYASLLEDGFQVRLSGQDSVRGTFFHRHVGINDQVSGDIHIPLQYLHKGQPTFLPINSLLSEAAVLGFEVGYSTADPNALVIWEAQFGDFANNAQVMIDQFISSSEAKWQRYSGLVMLLPHGYDGQGPEHSSARLERYLQLCAEENIQVCIPSTPAQMFHMLRRQMLRPYRKPLIVMSPKSLLRHKLSTSTLAEITAGEFQVLIDDIDEIDPQQITRVLFCSGKVYFDLLEARREHGIHDIAIARIEQQYPFPIEEVQAALSRYANASDIVWVQEEPRNQGSWYYMQSRRHLRACLKENHTLNYAGRSYSASPAVGYLHVHRAQQKALIEDALLLKGKLPQKQTADTDETG